METFESFEQIQLNRSWLAIGVFDGIHLGHQQILRGLVREARKATEPSVVMTFHPHPLIVLHNYREPLYLTSPQQRKEILENLGIDIVITQPFTKTFADQSAQEFLSRLSKHLNFCELWAGYDFALGKDRQADIGALDKMSKSLGYTLRKFDPITLDGEVVSSSAIRAKLQLGEVEKASRLLGRPYQVEGLIVQGDGRGTSLGVPTANIQPQSQTVIPKNGVYISEAILGKDKLKAVANVGIRPTFNGKHAGEPVLEIHILDFNRDIYAQRIQVNFLARLRDEIRFQQVEDLLDQVQNDIRAARLYFQDSQRLMPDQ